MPTLILTVTADDLYLEMRGIVSTPSTVQSLKGVVSAGFGKSLRYAGEKMRKWRNGGSGDIAERS